MPKPRTPKAKAEVSGAALHDPQRFKDRKSAKRTRSIGEPYIKMNDAQKEAWAELSYELPWLNSSHRPIVRLACMWMAKMDDEDFGTAATQTLSAILSKLGASPADESKVNHGDEDEEDPADKYFSRSH